MMDASGVRLIIEVDVDSDCRIVIKEPCEAGERLLLEVRSGVSRYQLGSLRSQFRRGLEALRQSLAEVEQQPRLPHTVKALANFHKVGRDILRTLFGFDENPGDLDEAYRLCRRAVWPAGQVTPRWDVSAPKARMVVLKCATDLGLSLEMLPLLGPFTPALETSLEGLGALAGDFLNFSAVVQRGPLKVANGVIENDPRLPVRLFTHSGIHAAGTIREYFRNSASFELDGDWPGSVSVEDEAVDLAEALWVHALDARRNPRDPPIQINHFACHCDEEEEPGAGSLLRFRRGALSRQLKVSVERLRTELREIRAREMKGTGGKVRPLVFLNACASADVDPSAVSSFSSDFGRGHFMGFIGTEAVIPEAFGFQFSRAFYEALLDGEGVGSALLSARWALLRQFKNPLGIVYCLRADPDIHVRKPRQRLKRPPAPYLAD